MACEQGFPPCKGSAQQRREKGWFATVVAILPHPKLFFADYAALRPSPLGEGNVGYLHLLIFFG